MGFELHEEGEGVYKIVSTNAVNDKLAKFISSFWSQGKLNTVKPVIRDHSKNRQNKGVNDKW